MGQEAKVKARPEDTIGKPKPRVGVSQRLLTVKESGIFLGLGPCRVRSLIYSGELAYVRLGRRILVDINDLERLVQTKKRKELQAVSENEVDNEEFSTSKGAEHA